MAVIEEGTVIAGTMRAEDVVPVLLAELERVDPRAAARWRLQFAAFSTASFTSA
jgi:hypothetical protein